MTHIRSRRLQHLALPATLSLALVPFAAMAATIRPVTSCADDNAADTLRAVIGVANSGDIIDLSELPAVDPACTNSTITLAQGEIAIAHNLTVQGPGANQLAIAAGGYSRVLHSTSTDAPYGNLRVEDLTISGGKVNGTGGCILATGAIVLDHATVSDCKADFGGGIAADAVTLSNGSRVIDNITDVDPGGTYSGGGIYAGSQFTCVDSTVSGNIAQYRGGGVMSRGSASIDGCTIETNGSLKYGGGLFLYTTTGSTVIKQSTISGNQAAKGGGIYSKGPLTIDNSTVAFNYGGASFGGGIQSAANIVATSTIFARNTNGNSTNPDIVLATGKTLTGFADLVMSINNVPLPGVIVTSLDPKLAPLGNHGGLTRTHALLTGSPAIDTGSNPLAATTDQRGSGFAREAPAGKPDIGAYERQPDEDEIFGNGFD